VAGALNTAKGAGRSERAATLAATLRALGGVLGLAQCHPDAWLENGGMGFGADGKPLARASTQLQSEGTEAASKAGTPEPGEGGAAAMPLCEQEIDARIEARAQARKNKNFAEADRIRDELAAAGIILEDGAGGTTWRRD